MRKILLVGWDSADWEIARPLMERGEMPHLARLVANGVAGNVATLHPPLSPMLWTSIATGKRPTKHGIHGFVEPTPDGCGIRPITSIGRKTKAIWNILNQEGKRSAIVGWWPSHPCEPIRGVMVSDFYGKMDVAMTVTSPRPGTIHPPEWIDRLSELRVAPGEIPGEAIRMFIPEYDRIDQGADRSIHKLARFLAETVTIHNAATDVIEHAEWDFAAVYYAGLDHLSHLFMRYHPPRLPWISEDEFVLYQHVVASAYRHHDAMLGRLIELAGEGVTVIVMSDHGFHSGRGRVMQLPAEEAGPAIEHRHFGLIAMAGPGIRTGEPLYGSSVLDITPTLLHLFGLPVGRDMDGKVLTTALDNPAAIRSIPSWDDVPGESGCHPPGTAADAAGDAAVFRQLMELGYVSPPSEDAAKMVEQIHRESKYNLARAYDDAGQPEQAVSIYERLLAASPHDPRFVERLVLGLLALERSGDARRAFVGFDSVCDDRGARAHEELLRRDAARPTDTLDTVVNPADHRECYERQRLAEQASAYPVLRAILKLKLDLTENLYKEVAGTIAFLEKIAEMGALPPGTFADLLFQAGESDRALSWTARALAADPDDWEVLRLEARIRYRRQEYEQTIDAALRTLELVYHQPIVHCVLGLALMAHGDYEEAEIALKTATVQMPGLVPAHEGLARLYGEYLNKPIEAAMYRAKASEMTGGAGG